MLLHFPPGRCIPGAEFIYVSSAAFMNSDASISNEMMELISAGSVMTKYPKKLSKKPEDYRVSVDLSTFQLLWEPCKKKKEKRSCLLKTNREVN